MTRFNIATPLESTPPFVLWTLVHACPLREASEFTNAEATERLLRGVRCYSDALAEQRVMQGVVVSKSPDNPPVGFQVEPVLEPLGGLDFITQCCSQCPANAIARQQPAALAGCVGYVVPPEKESAEFQRMLEELLITASNTAPRWYGLWIESPLSQDMLAVQVNMWNQYLSQANAPPVLGLADYQQALAVAMQHNLELRVQLYPPGICSGRRWTVAAHCGRCIAPWPEARRQQCRLCGQVGQRQPERIRRRMGTRPYRPLAEFIRPEDIEVLLKYFI